MHLSNIFILNVLAFILLASPVQANDFAAMTTPFPPYSISKGLHVDGISVDTLAVIMSLSGSPMQTDEIKLMLWEHGLKLAAEGSHKIMLNVPKTEQLEPLYKWVGPIGVSRYVIIGRKGDKRIVSIEDLNKYKVATIRNSMSERALLASGINKNVLKSSVTHVIPLKQLSMKMVDYFVHTEIATAYLMKKMRMQTDDYSVVLTFMEVPLYYAFSKDTKDSFIDKLNKNLTILKKPGKNGRSRFDKIVDKYLPQGTLRE